MNPTWEPLSHGSRRLTSIRIHLYKGPLALVPSKHFGPTNVIGLCINNNMIDRVQRFGSIVMFAPQGRPDILSREVGAHINVGMVNNLHGAWGLDALHQKTEISPSQIVRNTCRAGKAFRIKGVIAILLVHAAAHLVNNGTVTRPDEKATTLLGVRFAGMGVDLCQYFT